MRIKTHQKMPGIIDVFAAGDIKIDIPEIPLRLAPFKALKNFFKSRLLLIKFGMLASL